MIPLQSDAIQIMFSPAALTSGATNTSLVVDMLDYGAVQVIVSANSSTTTAIPVSITFQESDDLTTYTAIVSAGTATTSFPSQVTNATATNNTQAWASWNQPWGPNRKRYLNAVAVGPTANSCLGFAMLAIKSRGAIAPPVTTVAAKYTFPVS